MEYIWKLERIINKNFTYVYSIINRIKNSSFYDQKQKRKIDVIKNRFLEKESIIKNSSFISKKF